ncbi:DNA-binding domain-containing protein [Mucilaginibacter sp. HMF5004]|uniref:HvfC/BufC N-terminal domain-containing protein n=1 Tax=Mucilaginibacter rivuli TaxID=2857527 RepID=UPI001C5F6995|nr:DNA-binding domain-containing protein [Mucilaginibacter rivuli]MBW4889275.1 DNA-binding domain-containing protein [Mucilaginibacter rivuli]
MSELANIQKWLTSIIVKPGSINDKIIMADQHYGLRHTEVIKPAPNFSSGEKIGIYARGYVLRLMECMSAEYPALQHLLGKELFETFVKAYLVHSPPSSPDLYNLGANFAAFLKASQPKNADSNMFDLPVEVTLLERAIAEVSRCKGLEGTSQETETDDTVLYLFNTSTIRSSPCLMLLKLQFPLAGFVRSVQRGEEATTPLTGESFTAISRKDYIIHMHDMETWQWQFLKALQDTNDYMSAINSTADVCGMANSTVMADLMLWIPVALKFGYIYRDDNQVN